MKQLGKKDDLMTRPLWVGLISIAASVVAYGVISIFVDIPEPLIGWGLSIGIPAIVAPSIACIVRRYVLMIEKQNSELAELNTLNRKLFSIVSHDVRSPVASLKVLMEPLRQGRFSLEEARPLLQKLEDQTDQLLEFLDGILRWAHEQLDSENQKKELFLIAPSIQQTVKLFEEKRKEKNIQLQMGPLSHRAFGQAEAFSFVFRNLYQNALKFTTEGGHIAINATEENGKCFVMISDSGPGISNDEIQGIMNPSQHYTTPGSSGEIGTGLGISSSIHYLEDNNGELRVTSDVGKGTTFTVVLPAEAA
jgi:signal transduction histidine kinase